MNKPTPSDMKAMTDGDFCRAALNMPDRESADRLVAEYATRNNLEPNYVRWFIISWTGRMQRDRIARATELYEPPVLKMPLTEKAAAESPVPMKR